MSSDDPTVKLTNDKIEEASPQRMEERIRVLEEKVQKRGYDTRPIWEALQEQVNELQMVVGNLMSNVKDLRHDLDEMLNSQSSSKRKLCCFKLEYDNSTHRTEATEVVADFNTFEIYNGDSKVGEFKRSKVTDWWMEEI